MAYEKLPPKLRAEKRRAAAKRWYWQHRAQAVAIACRVRRTSRSRINSWHRARNAAARAHILALFGSCCQRCGYNDPRALQLDHRRGALEPNGHRYRAGTHLYHEILAGRRCILEFQLLCANCNMIKVSENHEWGHRLRRGQV